MNFGGDVIVVLVIHDVLLVDRIHELYHCTWPRTHLTTERYNDESQTVRFQRRIVKESLTLSPVHQLQINQHQLSQLSQLPQAVPLCPVWLASPRPDSSRSFASWSWPWPLPPRAEAYWSWWWTADLATLPVASVAFQRSSNIGDNPVTKGSKKDGKHLAIIKRLPDE